MFAPGKASSSSIKRSNNPYSLNSSENNKNTLKECLDSDSQQFHQYQQTTIEQSPFSLNIELKTTTHDVRNPSRIIDYLFSI